MIKVGVTFLVLGFKARFMWWKLKTQIIPLIQTKLMLQTIPMRTQLSSIPIRDLNQLLVASPPMEPPHSDPLIETNTPHYLEEHQFLGETSIRNNTYSPPTHFLQSLKASHKIQIKDSLRSSKLLKDPPKQATPAHKGKKKR